MDARSTCPGCRRSRWPIASGTRCSRFAAGRCDTFEGVSAWGGPGTLDDEEKGPVINRNGVTHVDKEAIKASVVQLLRAVGEDPTREGLQDTPRRIAELYEEILQGQFQDPREVLQVGFEENHQEMVIVRDIPF